MKKRSHILLLTALLIGCSTNATSSTAAEKLVQVDENIMQLGNFSVSLSVKDIAASRSFYEKLGFTVRSGDQEQNWLVMKNGSTIISLFQGMFEGNMMTFNPGWDNDANELPDFTDVRDLQRKVKANNIELLSKADEATTGPASFIIEDPDGNKILIDQFVSAPQ